MKMFLTKCRIHRTTLAIVLLVTLMLIVPAVFHSIDERDYALNASDGSRDRLAYVSQEGDLMLYDPVDRTETKLLEGVSSFVMAADGRVAFTRSDEDDTDLYLFDPEQPDRDPVNISQNSPLTNYAQEWSPDGRYLAFGSYEDSYDQTLFVWDGDTVTNVMPEDVLQNAVPFAVAWSYDGRLAFTISHPSSPQTIQPEIYLWDGRTTVNLSQNPDGWDSFSRWSGDGRLMFGSTRDDVWDVYVWDGVTFKDGLPDVAAFIPVAPELDVFSADWANDGLVTVTILANSASESNQIILWDMATETIVQRYPVSSDMASSWLAEGGEVIMSSQLASGLPSVYLDVEDLEGNILFSTHTGEFSWSPDRYLAYCAWDENRRWLLSIWDGVESWVVVTLSLRPVQWQQGGETFSCNNG